MSRNLDASRRWTQQGTALVASALDGLDEQALDAPTDLPGWNRKHLVAHLAANADALCNLVHWAATGEVTPMYSSMEQRNADIAAGAQRPGAELVEWFTRSSAELDAAMGALTGQQWSAEVLTAQGRTVPASETPWMRSREVMVHAVDLGAGVGFEDLPADFLAALCDDIVGRRNGAAGPAAVLRASDTGLEWALAGEGEPVVVTGSLAALAGYLAGRGTAGVADAAGGSAPDLAAWL